MSLGKIKQNVRGIQSRKELNRVVGLGTWKRNSIVHKIHLIYLHGTLDFF